jgi:hypothetical protein
MFNPTTTKSAEITFSEAQENILNFYGRYFYHELKNKFYQILLGASPLLKPDTQGMTQSDK